MRGKKKKVNPPARERLKFRVFGTKDRRLRRAIRNLVRSLGPLITGNMPAGVINVVFVNDRYITELNRRFRGLDRPTDVLSFSLNSATPVQDKERVVGEVYISREQARRQAKEMGVKMVDELVFLVRHGILHLAGFSHHQMRRVNR